jgi:FtsP/CotA-like multicopper oxidase with cupredoxin domain
MSRLRFLLVAVVAVPVLGQARGLAAAGIPASTPEPIAINDNRSAAGTLDGTRLTVRLETREGEWHPDGDNDPGVRVLAFALEGGPLQIPGPLIRVTEGTEVCALVRNRLEKEPLIIHGMYARSGAAAAPEPITIMPGEVREIRFLAGTPGTYYYWAQPPTRHFRRVPFETPNCTAPSWSNRAAATRETNASSSSASGRPLTTHSCPAR